MLTQTSIKKSLAFSTVSQMGYMILQCGLGLFGLAALHLVAHSLYKAHAFLSSGTVVAQKAPPALSDQPAAHSPAGFLALLVAGAVIVAGTGALFGVSLEKEPGVIVLGAVLVMALTTLLHGSLAAGRGHLFRSLALAAGIGTAYFALHHAANWLLASALPDAPPPVGLASALLMAGVVAAFAAVFFLQCHLTEIHKTSWGRRLYVLIFNRFYINAFVIRLVARLWPVTTHQHTTP
jgi:NAD(P)H-quinone oxidoreductase subunit 5